MNNDLDRRVTFCSACYATNEDGSWGTNGVSVDMVEKMGVDSYCMNCAGHGEVIIMSRRAADKIRSSASWVGKRYYPIEEDYLHYFYVNDENGHYTVKWKYEKGSTISPEGIQTVDQTAKVEAFDILEKSIEMLKGKANRSQ